MERHAPGRTQPAETEAILSESVPTVENQLAALQGQLDLLRTQVRQAQQLASLGTAAMTIAHEVNNVLTPILAWVQAAQRSNDPEIEKKALSVMMRNGEMLSAMCDRVLTIGAARSVSREYVSVRAAIDEAVASLCRDLSKDCIGLSVDADESVMVWADALQLRQVLFNLFLNAREAMLADRRGRLKISARRDGDTVTIVVRNTGASIPPELLPHVFEPLQTSKSSQGNGRQRCSGLGLALCRDLVEENGGTISVASEPEAGTTFTIKLPANKPVDE